MRIEKGRVVTLEYELRDARGEALEEADASLAYLHGHGGIFPKVEIALEGKQAGDDVSLTLEPDDAFGEYDAELMRVEPRERFPATLEVGMQFEGVPGGGEEGEAAGEGESRIYTVTDVTDDAVVVDANHPLAGERLWFKCSVRQVRAATEDELQHGHAHGDSGISTH